MRKLFIILLLVTTRIFAQVENSAGKFSYNTHPLFYYDIANYKSNSDSLTRVDVFIEVPYSRIQFLKSGNMYKSSYVVDISFKESETDNLILRRSWTETVKAKDFPVTTSSKNFNISYRSYNLKPGLYKMTIAVEVKNSDVKGKSESDVTVLRIDKPLDISDIMLVSKKISSGGIKKIVPNISREITTRDSVISFYYEIYSDSNRNVSISYQIRNLRKDKFYKQKIQREIQKGKNLIYQSLSVPDFSLGDYSLIVKVEDEKSGLKVGIGKKFSSKIYSFPETIKDLDLAIDQMIYIASPSEIDYIKSAKTYDEKLKRYLRFWKSKDPTPNTDENEVLDEYYRRVDYANEHFKSYYDGWRTDMGMIYITLGPPDQVERHPFEFDSKPYEIWDYFNLNRRFVFVDQTGFGDYRLINPDFTDWRYRY